MRLDWLRIYHEARNDAKLRTLTDSQFRVWFNLLLYASEQPSRGDILDYDLDLLAIEVSNCDTILLEETLERLSRLRIVVSEVGFISFSKFLDRQYDKPSDQPEQVKDRVSRHRATKRKEDVTPSNAPVTPSNAERREEKRREEESIGDTDAPAPETQPTAKTKSRSPTPAQTSIPDGFEPSPEMCDAAQAKYPKLDIEAATDEWVSSMRSNTVKYRYTDWNAAWWGGMKKADTWQKERGGKERDGETKYGRAVLKAGQEIAALGMEPVLRNGNGSALEDYQGADIFRLPSPQEDTRIG